MKDIKNAFLDLCFIMIAMIGYTLPFGFVGITNNPKAMIAYFIFALIYCLTFQRVMKWITNKRFS